MPSAQFTILLVGSTLVDGCVAGAALLARPRRADNPHPAALVGLGRVAFAAFVTSAIFIGKLPVLVGLGVNIFGLIHLTYVDVAILLPLVGTFLLASSRSRAAGARRRLTRPVRLLAVATLFLPAAALYATFVEPFRLQLEVADMPVSRKRAGGRADGTVDGPARGVEEGATRGAVRIGILADIQTDHISDYERSAVDKLMSLRPDLILLPGDLFQGTKEMFEVELPAFRELLSHLTAPGGAYTVIGNVDMPGRVEQAVRDTGVRLLTNEIVRVSIGERRLTIGGLERRYDTPAARRLIEKLEKAPGEDDIRILMAHHPDAVLLLSPESRIDLVVAGHTHGGQVCIPFFGPLMTFSRVPRRVAAGGLHRLEGNAIYVSRGVGSERGQAPRMRFLCPPEITLLTVGEIESHRGALFAASPD